MLIELFEKKWSDIRKIGREAADRGRALGLKTDWQEGREAPPAAHPEPEELALKRKA